MDPRYFKCWEPMLPEDGFTAEKGQEQLERMRLCREKVDHQYLIMTGILIGAAVLGFGSLLLMVIVKAAT